MASEAGGTNVNPVCGRRDFLDATVGGVVLTCRSLRPSRHAVPRIAIRVVRKDPRILAGVSGHPRRELWVRVCGRSTDGRCAL